LPAAPPCLRGDGVTFGSFNNLTKIGPEVIQLWAEILREVPNSRLLLKWKSLIDLPTRTKLAVTFEAFGVDPNRLILRGESRHPALLAEYADIDIALDPFPFSGGLTSCEALWMGVPVVTLPGTAAPSRQTWGFLQALGRNEWVAGSPRDYSRIAARLASDHQRLAEIRGSLRQQMAGSPLCDGPSFTGALEAVYRSVWQKWCVTRAANGRDVEDL
jgi:predicted O-linked N-acetylglucosamine transferase (SPINDLY family)